MGDVGLLDYKEASEWIRCLYVNGYGRVCLALDDRDVLKIWSELELAAQANASGIMLSKLALASNSYELLKKSAEKISQALSKLSRDNEGFAHDVPESDDGGSKNIGPANSSSKRWIVHNEVLTAHRPGPARLGKFVLHCSSHYVLLMTPRTRIIPPPLICAHETHQFSDPEWCNLKEDESRVLLMPIGTSPVLEFSGTTAVLLRTGRAFEVLCYENIPLIITFLRPTAVGDTDLVSAALLPVTCITKELSNCSPLLKDWSKKVTEIPRLQAAVLDKATRAQRRPRFLLADTKMCSVALDPECGIPTTLPSPRIASKKRMTTAQKKSGQHRSAGPVSASDLIDREASVKGFEMDYDSDSLQAYSAEEDGLVLTDIDDM
jgi:hypothetical protein